MALIKEGKIMNLKMKKIILTWFLSAFLVFSVVAGAYAYSSILAFGDSISDNGVYGQYADPAATYTSSSDSYGYRRYSDGPVWVEYLAQDFGLPLLDMAYGGAKTTATYPNLGWQIANYSGPIDSTILVTVLAGANDMEAYFNGNATETPAYAAANLFADIQILANEGFTNFFIPNLPNIGATVRYNGTVAQPYISAWCQAFNSYLAADLVTLKAEYSGADFMTFDTYSLTTDVVNNPAKYGFSSVNDIFWIDGYHTSTQAHQLMANYVKQTIPEPATMLLLSLGLMGLAGVRKKIRN